MTIHPVAHRVSQGGLIGSEDSTKYTYEVFLKCYAPFVL